MSPVSRSTYLSERSGADEKLLNPENERVEIGNGCCRNAMQNSVKTGQNGPGFQKNTLTAKFYGNVKQLATK
jgi:hypothetical protein